jgi:hypothetical protein
MLLPCPFQAVARNAWPINCWRVTTGWELATRATVAVAGEVVPQHHALPSQHFSEALVKVEFQASFCRACP